MSLKAFIESSRKSLGEYLDLLPQETQVLIQQGVKTHACFESSMLFSRNLKDQSHVKGKAQAKLSTSQNCP